MKNISVINSNKRCMFIDTEVFFALDLKSCGVHKCVENKDFTMLLIAYAFDQEEIKVIDLEKCDEIPKEFIHGLLDDNTIKLAFNAAFEIPCLSKALGLCLNAKQWTCISVLARMLGLPSSLDAVAKAMNINNGKLECGKELIKYFSMPQKETKANGGRTRNLPHDNSEKWEEFKLYCARDVMVARDIYNILKKYSICEMEQQVWELDQIINNRGIMVDKHLIDNAIVCCELYENRLKRELYNITGISSAKSVPKLKEWLKSCHGIEVSDLQKETVDKLLETATGEVKRVLEIRRNISKTSVKKFEAMDNALCEDGRIRGILQFHGAPRTGRWAGRQVQVHNLPRNTIDNLHSVREQLLNEELYNINNAPHNISTMLSQLIRTAFIPKEGSRFIIADFNSIEARVLSWLAGEKWRIDVFNSHGKIYEASAAMMFNVPMEEVKKGSHLRDKGKIAELALGYQGSKGALISMGALKMGLNEDDIEKLVTAWRAKNPNIVRLWWQVERCAVLAIKNQVPVYLDHNITFSCENGILFITLPSGRRLAYVNPSLEIDSRYDKLAINFYGINQETKKWDKQTTYGGKLTENIIQAIARDCLANAMLNLHERGYEIVMHIHDEVVLEVPKEKGSLEEVEEIMAMPIPWAKNLTLRAEAFQSMYYKKA